MAHPHELPARKHPKDCERVSSAGVLVGRGSCRHRAVSGRASGTVHPLASSGTGTGHRLAPRHRQYLGAHARRGPSRAAQGHAPEVGRQLHPPAQDVRCEYWQRAGEGVRHTCLRAQGADAVASVGPVHQSGWGRLLGGDHHRRRRVLRPAEPPPICTQLEVAHGCRDAGEQALIHGRVHGPTARRNDARTRPAVCPRAVQGQQGPGRRVEERAGEPGRQRHAVEHHLKGDREAPRRGGLGGRRLVARGRCAERRRRARAGGRVRPVPKRRGGARAAAQAERGARGVALDSPPLAGRPRAAEAAAGAVRARARSHRERARGP
ncbi:MAG: hypothetical protein CL844_05570 [Crocinitomicaceae bacterium]|nr:hypothetical protein [Crocinitomicaceae bacterium]